MPMVPLECPYCGYYITKVPVPNDDSTPLHNRSCSKCHKSFAWEGEYGRVITYKK